VTLLDVSGAAVIVMSTEETGAAVVVSNAGGAAVEDLQFTVGEGPCLRAFQTGSPVFEPELSDGSLFRWPEFSRQVVAAGARAVFALPLQLGAVRLVSVSDAPSRCAIPRPGHSPARSRVAASARCAHWLGSSM
jgi:hypothetical protein